MGRRTLLLLASILVAAAGTALLWVYVRNADERAQQTWGQQVWVLRATAAIDLGAGPDAVRASTERVAVPRGLAPAGAISDAGQLVGRTATAPVLPGQFLQFAQFDTVPSTTGVSKGMVAVSVTVADPNRVAGLLHPTMTVDVYYLAGTGDARAKALQGSARLLLAGVRVLAVGNTSVIRNAQGHPAQVGTQAGVAAAIVTLEVHPQEAPELMMADTIGSLWFTVPGDGVTPHQNDGYTGIQLPVGNS
ncbi:MAG TPA: Flp pilus assembly protein CpaB [Kineosporiaceae bacterium]